MSTYSKKKDFKDLSLLDAFLFALATENPQNAELIARTIIRRVFLYTEGELRGTEEIQSLLKYLEDSNEINAIDSELQQIHSVVSRIKNDEEVGEHNMTWEDVIEYEKRDSYEAGLEEGINKFISACRKIN